MNTRTPCVILYAVSLVVCVLVIFSLNKYERQGVPLHRLSSTCALVQDIYNGKGREKPMTQRQNWSNAKISHLLINLFIVSTGEDGSTDSLGEKMKEYFSSQIEYEWKDKPVGRSISDVKELFYVQPLLVSGDEMRSDGMRDIANICLGNTPGESNIHNIVNNRYFICLSENREEKDMGVVLTLKGNNTIHMKFIREEENATTYYQRLAEETWNIVKRIFFFKSPNRSLFFNPELDLNFYLASSLYNEGNYKVRKYNIAEGESNETANQSRERQSGGLPNDRPTEGRPTEGRPTEGRPTEGRPTEGRPAEGRPAEGRPTEEAPKSYASPVNIATWDFYKEVYYPYLRNFIEQLLNLFQINVYTQTIANIDLFKISEKEKEMEGKRVIILDKVNKFTNLFDNVIFGDILRKPTYHIPKSINLMAIFPTREEFFFYNPPTGKLETTVSFAEWGVIHLNNALGRKKVKREKEKIVNVSEEAPFICGFFISHLRQYLGLVANFSDYVFTIFDPDKYDIKYVRNESTDEGNSFLYSVHCKDNLQFNFSYDSPVKSGIFPFEILALMRQGYIYYVVEALNNLDKFVSISNVSIYFRVPVHALHVFNDILDKLKCSLDLMRGAEGCKIHQLGNTIRNSLQSYGGATSASSDEGNTRRVEAGLLRETYFRAAVVLAQSAYQDSLQLLSDDTFSIYDILSKDFLLASILPILIPYAIPVTFSLFRELFRSIKLAKEKQKVD
ncbi:conserved Plasmodium protein, unknown function [Plasmodium knowlesi strain H]|uniref:Uncharacterized protein n=3 Tax=Plasmodium knowlesi TaxID=5850 RepID=A0A5K1UJ84_PLAKH|nr:conserved Plasmodium protein, unknown function [Plasmodium knowlesi strain H]OTN63796.1 Uncharacterized protein PKNOH_S140286900 [Plasmodium knowlesi]CAA9991280.1 conserved Plasmodium protein, unknown function [Plasmodium knowlesi strain H]SBO26372.1 conserved Plasmodium protein, unknown function [Plasmodium knowlesi strain H]SBO29013.1 conserved Plasmodium protein, unknown function [Plasmodium knowlesi strain H]VVS80754.1 conserved Plasmodium protein, unknown function [Plasmodium knowlesi |eukprot:XP_002262558.1 hypothetical protein, conserved in Plasmodium species [Plasmodium knowlesi strain H]